MLPETVENKIRKIIAITNPNIYVVDIAMHQSKRSLLSILVDTDSGITLPECTEISRAISRYLDEEEPIETAFNLEVSSPGVGKPIRIPRQYLRHKGRELKVKMTDGNKIKGKLLGSDENGIRIAPPVEKKKKTAGAAPDKPLPSELFIPYSEIQEAVVLISFN